MEEVLYRYIADAASRNSITELMYLWLRTPYMEDGTVVRAAINSYIPALAADTDIVITEDMTFFDFVKEYDEQSYNRAPCSSPNDCLKYFSGKGDKRGVLTAINKGATYLHPAIMEAARNGHLELVKFFVEEKNEGLKFALIEAVSGNQRDVIEYLLNRGADPNDLLYSAAYIGNKDLIDLAIESGATDLNKGLRAAIETFRYDIIRYLVVDKGAVPSKHLLKEYQEWFDEAI